MQETTDLRARITGIFDDLGRSIPPGREESLLDAGVLDSMAVLELVNALEEGLDIMFEEEDLDIANFQGLSAIAKLVAKYMGDSAA